MDEYNQILSTITATAKNIMPQNAKVLLFGSQARKDAGKDSDWDLLILLDKNSIEPQDRDKYTYPFWELGWSINAMIHPIIYTLDEWNKKSFSPFYKNIQKEGIRLC